MNEINLIFVLIFTIAWLTDSIKCDVSYSIESPGNQCTYFGERHSSPEGNLVNCSWYSHNACCKRTEVTSVFGSMYPLYGATQECANQINYLMCYFCSPQQFRWYKKRLHVCSDFCHSIYDACKSAEYRGQRLGTNYGSGEEFCRGQKFEVVGGNSNCFHFDPNVFSDGDLIRVKWPLLVVITLFVSAVT